MDSNNNTITTQQKRGIDYTPEDCGARIKNELAHSSFMPDQEKWFTWVNNSAESMNWLIDMMQAAGYEVTIEASFFNPQHIWDSPAASHNFITGPGDFGAAIGRGSVMRVLEKHVSDAGGRIDYSTKAEHLKRDNDSTSRVTSVIASLGDGDDTPIKGLSNGGIMVGDMYGNCCNFSISSHNLGATYNTFPSLLGKALTSS